MMKAYWAIYVWPEGHLEDGFFAEESTGGLLPTLWWVIKLWFDQSDNGARYAIVRHPSANDIPFKW